MASSPQATYLGVTAAGLIGASGLQMVGPHQLGLIGAFLIGFALVTSELASRIIVRVEKAVAVPVAA